MRKNVFVRNRLHGLLLEPGTGVYLSGFLLSRSWELRLWQCSRTDCPPGLRNWRWGKSLTLRNRHAVQTTSLPSKRGTPEDPFQTLTNTSPDFVVCIQKLVFDLRVWLRCTLGGLLSSHFLWWGVKTVGSYCRRNRTMGFVPFLCFFDVIGSTCVCVFRSSFKII